MSKGSKVIELVNDNFLSDHVYNKRCFAALINQEVSLAYEKGFLSGYNQDECLKNPEGEASFEARKYTANNN